MKARVKATGEIVEVVANGNYYDTTDNKERYYSHELDFNDTTDYWTRLKHQYAGMAMQGICSSDIIMEKINRINAEGDKFGVLIAELSANLAHALVEKMKEEK